MMKANRGQKSRRFFFLPRLFAFVPLGLDALFLEPDVFLLYIDLFFQDLFLQPQALFLPFDFRFKIFLIAHYRRI